jgi:hypothetical protein
MFKQTIGPIEYINHHQNSRLAGLTPRESGSPLQLLQGGGNKTSVFAGIVLGKQ